MRLQQASSCLFFKRGCCISHAGLACRQVWGCCAPQSGMAEMSEKFKGVGAEVYLDEAAVAP